MAGTFRKKFRKNSGKTPETLSELFLEFPSRVRLGCPKPYNSRHLRLPEHFQNCLPPSTAGGASFFRSGSGERLSELVMEFPAVLGVFLRFLGHFQFTVLGGSTLAARLRSLVARFAEARRNLKGWFPKGWFWRMFPRNETQRAQRLKKKQSRLKISISLEFVFNLD